MNPAYQAWAAVIHQKLDPDGDDRDPIDWDREARSALGRWRGVYARQVPVEHDVALAYFDFVRHLSDVDDAERERLIAIALRDDAQPSRMTAAERAEAAGVSRSTEYRRRKAEGRVGARGRPKKA